MNAIALEGDRLERAAESIAEGAIYGRLSDLLVEGAPSQALKVSATNLVYDPQGLGDQSKWSAGGGTLAARDSGVPKPWLRQMVATWTSGTLAPQVVFTADRSGTCWWYALVRTSATSGSLNVRLRENFGALNVVSNVAVPLSSGWTLVKGSGPVTLGQAYRIEASIATPGPAGAELALTGATACTDADPGEPFSGDFPVTAGYGYLWRGGRNAGPSERRGPYFDLLSLREQEAGLNVNPAGLTVDQRSAYLLLRKQARHHPYGETFINLIVALVQQENPNFTAAGVRVVEDFRHYAFSVQIAYSPSGVLADRITRLIGEIQPCHLKLTGISWGTFQADVNKAGDPV